jgi:UDP-galactopyranose mutase
MGVEIMSKFLIVGAGLSGAVVARQLAEAGHTVKVIDSRYHIGGNCFDYINQHGIRVHKYGPHIFHTSNMKVVEWLSQFTEWIDYKHKVKAILKDGTYVTLPVNRETKAIVGEENVVDTFIRPYTKKMWAKDIEELDPNILNRVPIRDDDNELYFPNDAFQAMPKDGYTEMFKRIFDHENISISLDTDFHKSMESHYDHVFNSMPIDVYFDSKYGKLPYRSIKFHNVTVPSPKMLPVPTVNFTHSGPYTRMTEWKNYPGHGVNDEYTTLTYEEPCDYKDNFMERYYPVKDVNGENRAVYQKYREDIPDNMTFIGRCGLYVYTDMDQCVSSSLSTVNKFLDK